MNVKVKIDDEIEIIYMEGEPNYSGRIGIVTHIDDAGQIHGTWGGLAVLKDKDQYVILENK